LKCLVTGGAGFIGSHLVDRLVKDGHEVTVVDDLSTGKMENLEQAESKITFCLCDISSESRELHDIVTSTKPEVIFHQAALGSVPRSFEAPIRTFHVNVGGTLNVLECARDAGVRRVVAASSSSVYGDAGDRTQNSETQKLRPASPYAASKAALEVYCKAWAHMHRSGSPETVCLRYFNVYGPRQDPNVAYAAVVPKFIDSALAGRPLAIYGDGEQIRDFTYVYDVVEANILAATALGPFHGTPINIAAGFGTSVLTLAQEIIGLTGRDGGTVIQHVDKRPGDVGRSVASLYRAQEYLGFKAWWSIYGGLRATIEWFKNVVS